VLVKAFSPIFFAREDTATPMYAALVGFAVALVGSLMLLPSLGHVGVALAVSVSGWVSAGMLAVIIARRIGFSLDSNARYRLPRIGIAALVMGAVIKLMQMALASWLTGPSDFARLVALAALVSAGLAAYTALLHALGVARLGDLIKAARRSA
jgi:putative peptidoglycan lipid II flippase